MIVEYYRVFHEYLQKEKLAYPAFWN
jgi:hypothetical protein